jgi:hypothetical protein
MKTSIFIANMALLIYFVVAHVAMLEVFGIVPVVLGVALVLLTQALAITAVSTQYDLNYRSPTLTKE